MSTGTQSLSPSETEWSFIILNFISFFKYIRMRPLFLPVFLSLCIKSKFGKWKVELSLKSLSVVHVSVTEIMIKKFEQFKRRS